MRVALGLGAHLDAFANENGADTYRQWGPDDYRTGLLVVASDPETRFYWNLTGINVAWGLQRAAGGFGGATDWELSQFKGNIDWIDRSFWWNVDEWCECPEELAQ